MLPQDKAANTRMQNVQTAAKTSFQPGLQPSGLPKVNNSRSPIRRPLPQNPQPSQGLPTGRLGSFVRQQEQGPASQAIAPQPDPKAQVIAEFQRQLEVEEFMQSPAVQQAVTRTKLADYFARDRNEEPKDYAASVLNYMSRY